MTKMYVRAFYRSKLNLLAQLMCLWLSGVALGCGSCEPPALRAMSTTRASRSPQPAAETASTVDDQIPSEPCDSPVDDDETAANPFDRGEAGVLEAARAVDFVFSEIHESLARKAVLVVWLFDATTSAEGLRQQVVSRIEHDCGILDECRQDGTPAEHAPLWWAISFGQKSKSLVPEPTPDADALQSALRSIATDGSAIENTFAALDSALDALALDGNRERYIFFVIVTDERGDDMDRVDAVLARLKKTPIQVYVIGPAAPFGYEGSLTPVALVENWQPLRQGPESRELELVDVTASARSQATALMDSGCGPFALTYLTRETDGRYFIVHQEPEPQPAGIDFSPPSAVVRFDPRIVARYLPEYVSAEEYRRLQNDNRARRALCQAAKLPHIALATNLKREFAQSDAAALKRQLDLAQRVVARLEPHLMQFYETLATGEVDSPRLPPRWQANYWLAMGRVLAARARLEGYNAMLARLKTTGKFQRPESTHWILEESATFAGDSALNKLAARARDYLQRVVAEHAGTPWAWLADQELKVPMAWTWAEK